MTIEQIRHDISHVCDGPVTAFVLISRACELRSEDPSAVANALAEELQDRGFLTPDANTPYDVGS